LYDRYDEELLIMVAFDANNNWIFQLTFEIINEENNDN
jgi:hypothetical protein